MRIELEMVEVEGSIFISGSNLGPRIFRDTKGGVDMWYDTESELTYMVHKNKTWIGKAKGMIILSEAPKQDKREPYVGFATGVTVKAQVTGPEKTIRTAQVSTPMDKVQGGAKKRAKYQGEEV